VACVMVVCMSDCASDCVYACMWRGLHVLFTTISGDSNSALPCSQVLPKGFIFFVFYISNYWSRINVDEFAKMNLALILKLKRLLCCDKASFHCIVYV
jgi:hypothetical protein